MADRLNVLVAGATGRQGSMLIDHLLAAGHTVTGLTSEPSGKAAEGLEKGGVTLVEGELGKGETVKKAAKGVDVVFLVTTPDEPAPDAEAKQGTEAIKALKAAKVPHVVYSSMASADQKTGVPLFESKHKVEDALKKSGIPHSIVAPVLLRDTLTDPEAHATLAQGLIRIPLTADTPLQATGLREQCAFHAYAVTNHADLAGERIEIASDVATPLSIAEAIEDASGHAITLEQVDLDALYKEDADSAKLYAWLGDEGYNVDLRRLHKQYPGIPWRTTREWAGEKDWSWIQSPVALH